MKRFVTVFAAAVLCSVFLPAAAGSAEAADPKAMCEIAFCSESNRFFAHRRTKNSTLQLSLCKTTGWKIYFTY